MVKLSCYCLEPCTLIIIRLVLITHTSGTALYIRTGAEDSYGTYSIPGIPYIELAAILLLARSLSIDII